MDKFSISVFDNKTFFQIIKEIKLFSKYKINHYEDFNLCIKDAEKGNHVVVFFINPFDKNRKYNFPSILIVKSLNSSNILSNILNEELKIPFTIFEFEKKITSAIAKNEF